MYQNFDQLPLVLSVSEVAQALNLGRDTTSRSPSMITVRADDTP